MIQFAALFNELTSSGGEHFAKFLNTASSADASQAGRWLSSATGAQVKKAAALLNEGELDEFRDFIGIGQGFWAWLFGKRKQKTPVPAVRTATAKPSAKPAKPSVKLATVKASAKLATAKPSAKPATSITNCPKCGRKLKYRLESAGKKAKCSECAHLFRLPPSSEKAANAVQAPLQPKADSEWQALCAYLHERRPAEISTVKEACAVPVILQYHEAVVADQTCPKLTYYLLKPTAGATGTFSYLVVATGEKSEHDRAWNFKYESILKRALPGKTWSDFTWEGGYSNHSKPGCQLASTAGFDRLVNAIVQGSYQLDRVLRPSVSKNDDQIVEATGKKPQRWDVLIFGETVVRPDLACQICGDNLVAPGFNGSHLRCHTCGTIYCKRNCQASIHGQCPRCGETDRIDGVD